MNVFCFLGFHRKELEINEPKSDGKEISIGVALVCPGSGCGKTYQKIEWKLRIGAPSAHPEGTEVNMSIEQIAKKNDTFFEELDTP